MKIKDTTINIIKGDITELVIDAIVNPSSYELKMADGLAAVIKKKGGEEIEIDAMAKGPIRVGDAVSTHAGKLKANHIIHTVTVTSDRKTDDEILRRSIVSALKRADELEIHSLAFPALGCGTGGFPVLGAGKIMVQEIVKFLKNPDRQLKQITFCLFDEQTFDVFDQGVRGYIHHLQAVLGPGPYVTVDVIIEMSHGIVLIERSNPPYGWALPGGFVDYGETLEQAAVREAKEETNLGLADLRQFHTYSDPARDPRFHTISTVFIACGKGNPRSGSDAKGLKIVPFEELPTLEYAFDHKQIIKEYLVERDFDY